MTHQTASFFLIFMAYLFGSLPIGLMVGRMVKGIDVRDYGSGNIGATNVWRTMGPLWGIAVFLFDFCKGYVPTLLVRGIPQVPTWMPVPRMAATHVLHVPDWLPVAVGLAAILGHNFSPFLRLKGGKGVATSLGVVFGLSPTAALAGFAVWVLCLLATRYISLSSLIGAVVASAVLIYYHRDPAHVIFALLVTLFVFLRHRANITRIQGGSEPKVSFPWAKK